MNNWLFALVVLAFGVLLSVFVDRLKRAPGPRQERNERRKWLHVWLTGRLPSPEEEREEDRRDGGGRGRKDQGG